MIARTTITSGMMNFFCLNQGCPVVVILKMIDQTPPIARRGKVFLQAG
jgi:hypothetical protein